MRDLQENSLTIPSWLNQEFLQDALKDRYGNGSLTFSNFSIQPATKKGDNYLSQMLRMNATIKNQEMGQRNISAIVKILPVGEMATKFVEESNIFRKEAIMFKIVLPLFEKVLKDNKLPKLFASMFYEQGPPNNLFILEDLKTDGFQSADRINGLDLPHSILVVESIATFHAVSLKAIQEKPDLKTYRPFWTKETGEKNEKWVFSSINELAKVVSKWEDQPKDLPKKLIDFKEVFAERLYSNCDPNNDELNVLIHGDLWTTNTMFRYENNCPVALKFVDFQLCSYTSPAIDLHYFIFSSPKPYVRDNHLNMLLESYYRQLVYVCDKINIPLKFSFGDLREMFFKKLVYGFAISVTMFPLSTITSESATDMNEMVDDDHIVLEPKYFQSKVFEKGMKSMLKIFLENGLFD